MAYFEMLDNHKSVFKKNASWGVFHKNNWCFESIKITKEKEKLKIYDKLNTMFEKRKNPVVFFLLTYRQYLQSNLKQQMWKLFLVQQAVLHGP